MSAKKTKKPRTKSTVREYLEMLAETAVFVFFILTFVVQSFGIPTGSMEPTLLIGDFLLVNKMIHASTAFSWEGAVLPRRPLRRGDIVAFKAPPEDLKKDYVKRVIGLEGDRLEVRNKQVLINGQPLQEKYKVHLYGAMPLDSDNFGPVTVPAGHVFVMGDNRDNSADSRVWGFLPVDYIKGTPWIIYFSYKSDPDAYLKTGLRDRLGRFLTFLPKARWDRLFRLIH